MLVDGKDISTLNVQSYRKAVALVQQEPTLYSGTIGFNIALGAFVPPEEVTQEQIEAAAKKANIHDFVMGLPDAYNTEVGGKGASLSGGQKRQSAFSLGPSQMHFWMLTIFLLRKQNVWPSRARSSVTRRSCCWTSTFGCFPSSPRTPD